MVISNATTGNLSRLFILIVLIYCGFHILCCSYFEFVVLVMFMFCDIVFTLSICGVHYVPSLCHPYIVAFAVVLLFIFCGVSGFHILNFWCWWCSLIMSVVVL